MNALRAHRDGGQDQFGRRAIAEFRSPVMLDLPPDLEAGRVGGARLLERVEDQAALMIGRERPGQRVWPDALLGDGAAAAHRAGQPGDDPQLRRPAQPGPAEIVLGESGGPRA